MAAAAVESRVRRQQDEFEALVAQHPADDPLQFEGVGTPNLVISFGGEAIVVRGKWKNKFLVAVKVFADPCKTVDACTYAQALAGVRVPGTMFMQQWQVCAVLPAPRVSCPFLPRYKASRLPSCTGPISTSAPSGNTFPTTPLC
jgi:hypothetical protein